MCSYPEDDNLAQLLGLPADDILLLQRENVWYPAQSVLLYLVAYTMMFLYGHVVHAYVSVVAYILSPLVTRFLSVALKSRLKIGPHFDMGIVATWHLTTVGFSPVISPYFTSLYFVNQRMFLTWLFPVVQMKCLNCWSGIQVPSW